MTRPVSNRIALTRPQKFALGVGWMGACLLLGFSGGLGGKNGLAGAADGLAVGVWTVGTLAILAYALMRDKTQPREGVVKTLLAGVLKLPITLLLLYVGATLPPPGLGCFLGGLGLVYSCTVLFVVGTSHE